MIKYGIGTDGRIIANQSLNAGAGSVVGIADIRDSESLSIELISRNRTGALVGAWKIEASNNYSPTAGGTNFGQPANAGDWVDVTALFTPAITAAIGADSAQMVQPSERPCGWRAIQVTATYTSGTSAVIDVWICGKGH